MKLSEFLADPDNPHRGQGNPGVKCNALYKATTNVNCYLTPSQAIQFARNLLQKAQLILDANLEDAAVQVWNTGRKSKTLYCGLDTARKGARGKRPKSKG